MFRSKSLVTLLAIAVATGTIAASAALSGDETPRLKALSSRSEALNGKYGIIRPAKSTAPTNSAVWQRERIIGGDALNRQYGEGDCLPKSP